MTNIEKILARYDQARDAWVEESTANPETWQTHDQVEFAAIRDELLPHAEAGDMRCQYALASMLWFDLCEPYANEADFNKRHDHRTACTTASRWWAKAARQGCWPALDDLTTFGIGPEADEARAAKDELLKERPDLVIGMQDNLPGPDFMRELSRKLYGVADAEVF